MADQDYPNLYADMEAAAQRTRAAAIAFEHVLGGPEQDMVPVNGYPDQPTIAGRVKARIDPLVETLESAAESVKRFAGVHASAPGTRTDGSPLQPGDEYQNSSTGLRFSWSGTSWVALNASVQELQLELQPQIDASAKKAELLAPTGASTVWNGESSVADQLDALGARYVGTDEFKPLQDGTADDYPAIASAIAKAIATKRALLLRGPYRTSQTVDLSKCPIVFADNVEITPLFEQGIGVQWKAAPGQILTDLRQVGDIHVKWPTADYSKERVGFVFQNSYHGSFDISASNATVGFKTLGEGGRGCVYNDINIGVMANCQVSHWLESLSASSWCNANRMFGGRWYGGMNPENGLYSAIAGHLVMLGEVYTDNGNEWISPSLERTGAIGFRLARLRGQNNRVRPVYAEMKGDVTWIVDVGTSNKIDVESVPYGGGYDIGLTGPESRIDVSAAISPVVIGTFSYKDCGPGRTVHVVNGPRPGLLGINKGVGGGIAGQNGSASRNSIEALGPDGLLGVGIPAAGTWTVYAGTKKVGWSMALIPTAGTWTRGDIVFATNPVAGGSIGWVCTVSGTPGTWKPWGTIGA